MTDWRPPMRHLVLSGFMATGKSTLGPITAAKLGLPFVDTDDAVAAATGKSVPEIWQAEGEAGFRTLEEGVVMDLLSREEPHVLAFGGGAVTIDRVRRFAHQRACLVTLEAAPSVILDRVGDRKSRPTLETKDPRARVENLLRGRTEAYAECHARIPTDRGSEEESAEAVVAAYRRSPVLVALGKRSYTVEVVHDEPRRLTEAIERLSPTRVLVGMDTTVERACRARLEAAVRPLQVPVHYVAQPPGELHKTLASVEVLWSLAIGAGADRQSVFLAFGGGVVSDLTGFAASTLFRGVRFVGAPTTLLGMVDAAIGGKTGFDLAGGKNLIGSIHQPSGVVCDLAHLATLGARERNAGLAEVVKIALVADAELFDRLRTEAPRLARGEPEALLPVVRRAIEWKARFVMDDESDVGRRALLNVGHTVGHALEAHGGFSRLLHGEAVSIGIAVELGAATALGMTDGKVAEAATSLLSTLGLPTQTPDLRSAWGFASTDKKRKGSDLDWPIATRVGEGRVIRIAAEKVREAILGPR
jgi:shikimate kinase/3-dehydroquinate synthase